MSWSSTDDQSLWTDSLVQGQKETPAVPIETPHDSKCYLCPGNKRTTGQHNPDYKGIYVSRETAL